LVIFFLNLSWMLANVFVSEIKIVECSLVIFLAVVVGEAILTPELQFSANVTSVEQCPR
jgi:hypothetical protein